MRALWWPLGAVAVLGHVGLGALALVEYVRLDWLTSEPYEMSMVTLVAGTSALAVSGAVRAAWPAARGARAIRRRLGATNQALGATNQALAVAPAARGLAG